MTKKFFKVNSELYVDPLKVDALCVTYDPTVPEEGDYKVWWHMREKSFYASFYDRESAREYVEKFLKFCENNQ